MPTSTPLCANCLRCADACPRGLHPSLLFHGAAQWDQEVLDDGNAEQCDGCGRCTTICPQHLPLTATIRAAVDTDTHPPETSVSENVNNRWPFRLTRPTGAWLTAIYCIATSLHGRVVLVNLLIAVLVGLSLDAIFRRLTAATATGSLPATVLVPLFLPASVPPWLTAIATAASLVFCLYLFGGWSRHLVSPVAATAVFASVSFPDQWAASWLAGGGSQPTWILNTTYSLPIDSSPLTLLVFLAWQLGCRRLDHRLALGCLSAAVLAVFAAPATGGSANGMTEMLGASGLLGALALLGLDPFCQARTGRGRLLTGILLTVASLALFRHAHTPMAATLAVFWLGLLTPLFDRILARHSVTSHPPTPATTPKAP